MSNGYGFCKEIENESSRRKSASLRRLRSRKQGLKAEYPEVYSAYRGLMDATLDLADKIVASPADEPALRALADEMISAKQGELVKALAASGLPADYLEPHFVCPVCRDSGMVDGEVCACMKQILIDSKFKGSGVDRNQRFENFRHDLFDDPRHRRALDGVYAYCLEYAERFPENELPDLLLMGVPGVGKTYLLNCIGTRVLERGHSVLRVSANRLINSTLEAIRNNESSLPDFTLPELLIIDDLGAEPMINNITLETLLSIICERQDGGRATLIATNKDIGDLQEEYGQRIFSRMISPRRVRVFNITTPSIRMMKL